MKRIDDKLEEKLENILNSIVKCIDKLLQSPIDWACNHPTLTAFSIGLALTIYIIFVVVWGFLQ